MGDQADILTPPFVSRSDLLAPLLAPLLVPFLRFLVLNTDYQPDLQLRLQLNRIYLSLYHFYLFFAYQYNSVHGSAAIEIELLLSVEYGRGMAWRLKFSA